MAETTMAVIAPVPGRLGQQMNRLRRKLDPDGQLSMAAHIPIVGPFRVQPSFLPLEQHCWRVCHETAPIAVELGDLVLEDEGGLAYSDIVTGRDELLALRQKLTSGKYAAPADEGSGEPRALVGRVSYRDELALARWEEFAEKSNRSFLLERVDLMAQYPDGTWYERDFYTLDRAVTRA
jgi:hypothetical protein